MERFAQKYLKIPKINSNNKVVVSLYTSKASLNDIKPTINSILDQTARPDLIIVSSNKLVEIPASVSKSFVIVQYHLAKDYDKVSPLLSPLLREKDADTKIIILNADSGNIYGPDLLQVLVEESNEFPDSIIYVKGYNAQKFVDTHSKVDNEGTNDIVDINHGVLVKPKFFKDDVLLTKSINAPNVTLSAYSADTPKKKIHYKDTFATKPKDEDENAEKLGAIFYASRLSSFK
jgi:hypothetical protein